MHISPEAIEVARKHNIDMLGYPPHCTDALQGLNVVVFATLKKKYGAVVRKFEKNNPVKVGKNNFISVLAMAWEQTMTEKNILASFRKTGVWLVDRSVITPEQLASAKANSIKPGFPMVTASPAEAIIAAM